MVISSRAWVDNAHVRARTHTYKCSHNSVQERVSVVSRVSEEEGSTGVNRPPLEGVYGNKFSSLGGHTHHQGESVVFV